jgi:hypothetical protein
MSPPRSWKGLRAAVKIFLSSLFTRRKGPSCSDTQESSRQGSPSLGAASEASDQQDQLTEAARGSSQFQLISARASEVVITECGPAESLPSPSPTPVNNLPQSPQASQTGQESDQGECPLWTESIENFKSKEPRLSEYINAKVQKFQDLDVAGWDMWSKPRSEAGDESPSWRMKWSHRFKTYLPSLKLVKCVGTTLSNLDPHRVAPFVCLGVITFIEVRNLRCDPLDFQTTKTNHNGSLSKI